MFKKAIDHPYFWLLPLLVILVIFVIIPLCITTIYSFYNVDLRYMDQQTFAGFGNYIKLAYDHEVINSLENSFFYLLVSLFVETILGIVVALALKEKFRGRGIILAILIIPWALPPVVNSILWRLILDPTSGLWNDLLYRFNIIDSYQVWLNNPVWSKWMIALVHVWKMLPFIIIIFLAKLQTLSNDIMEAAKIDGANYLQRFYWIVFPFLKPVMVITLAQGTIAAFHLFDEAYIMTGTALDTRSILIQDYMICFRGMNLGSGMALSLIASLISLIFMFIFTKLREEKKA